MPGSVIDSRLPRESYRLFQSTDTLPVAGSAKRRVDTTLLLAPEGTVETMRDIEGTFGTVPFSGEAKAERVGELMKTAIDDATLAALLA